MATILIELELTEGDDPEAVIECVDGALDVGAIQDAITDGNGETPVGFVSAKCRFAPTVDDVDSPEWMKRFRAGQAEMLLAAQNGYAEGAADYSGRAGDVANGAQPPEWAWPMTGADDAYLAAVGVIQMCGNAGIDPERWDVVSDTWLLAWRAGYTEAHERRGQGAQHSHFYRVVPLGPRKETDR